MCKRPLKLAPPLAHRHMILHRTGMQLRTPMLDCLLMAYFVLALVGAALNLAFLHAFVRAFGLYVDPPVPRPLPTLCPVLAALALLLARVISAAVAVPLVAVQKAADQEAAPALHSTWLQFPLPFGYSEFASVDLVYPFFLERCLLSFQY